MKFYYRSILLFFGIICLGLSVILFKELRIGAQTLPPDVGLVTQLTGEATYWNETYQKTPEKAQVFMKIRRGDHFKVVSGTMIQLVYFQNGRQETWKGLAELVVGNGESRIEGEKGAQVKPEVLILPVDTSQGMRRIPVLLRRARLSRSGAMQVRGAGEASQKAIIPSREERAEIAMARETYQKLRKQTKADDITPELNLLGILADYEQYEAMEKIIKEALKVQPGNEVLKELDEWVKAQKSKGTIKK